MHFNHAVITLYDTSLTTIIFICCPLCCPPVKIVPDMTYNVFGGTLNPTLRLHVHSVRPCSFAFALFYFIYAHPLISHVGYTYTERQLTLNSVSLIRFFIVSCTLLNN